MYGEEDRAEGEENEGDAILVDGRVFGDGDLLELGAGLLD
jgi:hypothetical protein